MENVDTEVKAAVKRMCTTLEEKGVTVKHSLMLEALAHSLGLENWRTLKAKLNAPAKAPPVVFKEPRAGSQKRWDVSAVYLDNDQPYEQFAVARTAREAGVKATLERWAADLLHIGIVCVDFEGLGPVGIGNYQGYCADSIREYSLPNTAACMKRLLHYVNSCPQVENDYLGAVLWLRELVKAFPYDPKRPSIDTLEDYCEGGIVEQYVPGEFENKSEAEKCTIFEDVDMTPSQALIVIVDALEYSTGDSLYAAECEDMDRTLDLYFVREWVAIYGPILDSAEDGLGFDMPMP